MLQFLVTLQSFIADRLERDDKGATAVEYGLMVGLIAIAIITMVTAFGTSVGALFTRLAGDVGLIAP